MEMDRGLGQSPRYLEAISVPSATSVCSDLLFSLCLSLCLRVSVVNALQTFRRATHTGIAARRSGSAIAFITFSKPAKSRDCAPSESARSGQG